MLDLDLEPLNWHEYKKYFNILPRWTTLKQTPYACDYTFHDLLECTLPGNHKYYHIAHGADNEIIRAENNVETLSWPL